MNMQPTYPGRTQQRYCNTQSPLHTPTEGPNSFVCIREQVHLNHRDKDYHNQSLDHAIHCDFSPDTCGDNLPDSKEKVPLSSLLTKVSS